MNKAFKGGNVLWIIGIIVSILCVVGLLSLIFQERSRRIKTEQDLSEVKQAKAVIESQLGQVQEQLIQQKERASFLAQQAEQEKRNFQQAVQELSKKDVQISNLTGNLENEKKHRELLVENLTQAEEARQALNEKLKAAEAELENLKGKIDNAKSSKKGVELKKIVVKPKRDELNGRVLVVNREFQFIVIDLGIKDGLKVGDEFKVYWNTEEIGKVQIEKIYDAMSTATILAGSQIHRISENSTVKSF